MVEYRLRKELSGEIEKRARLIKEELGLESATAYLLALRGLADVKDAKKFLYPTLDDLHDPFLFQPMQKFVKRIGEAMEQKQKITIYSDYDADGTTAASILYLHLQSLGTDIHIYTPHRHKEGYGLNIAAVQGIAKDNTKLLITVDCGITNVEEVRLAKEAGMDVIITDHHECPQTLPDADIIINPKLPGCEYPFRHLCGAGVAFKLVEALSGRQSALKLIDLAALGTVADIVPLLGENRVIASLGIHKMRESACAGIRLLAEAAGINLKTIDSRSVSFGLAPRINAASRMDDAKLAVALLTALEENEEARGLAVLLCEHNKTRQQIEENILKEALQKLSETDLLLNWAIVLEDEGWNVGVIGIVCSQLCEMLARPVILFGREGENYIGSARSTDEINIFDALNRFSDLFVRFGGHARAAGLTVKKENLPILRQKLNEYILRTYSEQSMVKRTMYDLSLQVGDVNAKLIKELEAFQPYGQDNPAALFLFKDLKVKSHSFVGKASKDHLRLTLAEGGKKINAVCFNHVQKYCYLSNDNAYLAAISVNDFDRMSQMQIHGIKPSISKDTIAAYSRFLKQDFTWSFIDEVKAYKAFEDNQAAWIESLEKDLQNSLFGTLILCNSMAGFKKAMQLKPITDAIKQGRLNILCEAEGSFDTGNLFAGVTALNESLPNRYRKVYLIGGFSLEVHPKVERYFDADLQKYYALAAKEYFLNREELIKCYRLMQGKCFEQAESLQKLVALFNLSLEKALFMANVFLDLGLIDCINRDKIQFKTNVPKDKKDLMSSLTYCSFLNIMKHQS